MGKYYPIKTLDGVDYSGPPGLEMLLAMKAPPYGTELDIPVYDGSMGHFIYCYTALATIVVGGCVEISLTGSLVTTGDYKNPNATIPATTAIPHRRGIATKTVAAAGGLWVQIKGRCFFARVVDPATTDIVIGAHLKAVTAVQYITLDHATARTTSGFAVFEGCRHNSGGATKWTNVVVRGTATYPFPSLVDWPIYRVPETLALAQQGDTTYGDPASVIYLSGLESIVG